MLLAGKTGGACRDIALTGSKGTETRRTWKQECDRIRMKQQQSIFVDTKRDIILCHIRL